MFKLIVNPDTDQAWDIELPEGVTTIGRAADNPIPLDHESVSERHCEIVVGDGAVTVRDLGSERGVVVGGQLVEEAALIPGQRVRLGEVELAFAQEESVAAAAEAAPAAPPRCKHHPRAWPHWRCPACDNLYCDSCVSVRPGGSSTNHFCRRCGGECEAFSAPIQVEEPVTLGSALRGCFKYPFKGNGPFLLATGTVVFLLLDLMRFLASVVPLMGLVAVVILFVFATGYFFNYAKRIVISSTQGENEMPSWPAYEDFGEDIFRPFGQCLALGILSFGPALMAVIWQPVNPLITLLLLILALGWAAVVFPMGMLAVSMFDGIGALNPVALVISIFRIPGPYFLAMLVFGPVFALYVLDEWLLKQLIPVPVVPALLTGFVNLYLIVVGMRILGGMYRATKDRLAWFSQRAR